MKKPDWKILSTAMLYSLLFYKQEAGLNFFVFSIVISVFSLLQDVKKIYQPAWVTVALGTVVSGFFVFYYGTNLPKVAFTLSLMFLAGYTFKASNSLLIAAINAFSSLVLSIPLLINDLIIDRKNVTHSNNKKSKWFKKTMLLFFPLFVVFVFFVLYRDSNPLFLKITEDINLDWLSFPLVQHFLIGLLLMYSFFVHSTIKRLNALDERIKDDIEFVNQERHNNGFISRFLSLESEGYIALSLLIMLNLLIALLNGIDINYLWLNAALPQDLVFSDYLHTGTFTLIVSILLAIAIIVVFFRGIFNFNKKGEKLKILGWFWLVQNMIMVVSAMLRNKIYIEQYGLTHKRIGVFVFLLLALIGLVLTNIKIFKKKNIWFLLRKNAWAFYAVLIFSTLINWDFQITKYNIQNANKNHIVDLDKDYLARLSFVNTYMLLSQEEEYSPIEIYDNSAFSSHYRPPLQRKMQRLLDYRNRKQIQEFCLNKEFNIGEIIKRNEKGQIKKLLLGRENLNKLPIYKSLSNIQGLNLYKNELKNSLGALVNYKEIEALNLSQNQISSLDSLPELKHLTHLNLSSNQIKKFDKLEAFQNLRKLNISSNHAEIDIETFPVLKNLEEINLSQTNLSDWSFLAKQKNLKKIICNNSNIFFIKMKGNDAVETVELEQIKFSKNYKTFFDSLSVFSNLKKINLSGSNLGSLHVLIQGEKSLPLFENLESLNASNNQLQTEARFIQNYSHLKSLNLSSNKIRQINYLKELIHLDTLDISRNIINKLEGLKAYKSLRKLNLSNNKVKNLEIISKLQNIESLNVSQNKLYDINGILNLKRLSHLDFSGNKIEDISQLKELTNLKYLYIADMNLKDYSFLLEMNNLKYLSLGEVDLALVERLKEKFPKLEIDYFSKNLNKNINYNNNRRSVYNEKF